MANLNERIVMHGHATYVLIHGATGSEASWDQVAPFLRALGHRVYAPTLPAHGGMPGDLGAQTMSGYGRFVADFITGIWEQTGEKVILVGHSMGGAVISAAAELVPEKIDRLVYMAAWMLEDGWSCNQPGSSYEPHAFVTSRDGRTVGGEDFVEILPDGTRRLRDRPEGFSVPQLYAHTFYEGQPDPFARESIAALHERIHVTPERWGSVRRFYIEAMRDDSITYEVEEKMLAALPVEKIYEINCGHSPQVTMAEELCVILHDISRQ